MAERRSVTDEEFRVAMANHDNATLIKSITNKYSSVLSNEDLRTCGMTALWRCLQYHREGFNQKFTTSLWRFVRWECDRELRRQNGKASRPKHVPLYEDQMSKQEKQSEWDEINENLDHVRTRMEQLPREYQLVIKQYYFDHMTMEQIGRTNGYSKEAARQKIGKAVVQLRDICLAGV